MCLFALRYYAHWFFYARSHGSNDIVAVNITQSFGIAAYVIGYILGVKLTMTAHCRNFEVKLQDSSDLYPHEIGQVFFNLKIQRSTALRTFVVAIALTNCTHCSLLTSEALTETTREHCNHIHNNLRIGFHVQGRKDLSGNICASPCGGVLDDLGESELSRCTFRIWFVHSLRGI